MTIARELITRFGFQVDSGKIDQFEATIADLRTQLSALQEKFSGIEGTAKTSGEAMAGAFAAVQEEAAGAGRAVSVFGEKMAALRAQAVETGAAIKRSLGVNATGGAVASEEGALASGATAGHGGKHGMFGHIGGLVAGYFGLEAGMGLVEDFSKFQQNMQKAGANMLASKDEIAKMNKSALDMAVGLNQTPEELSEALMEIGLQGVHSGDALKVLPVAARFSRAVMASPTESAELIASTTRNFYGKDFSKAGHVGDVLSRVHELGGIKAQELLDAMKYVAPTAHAMGQSFESIAADMAILGQSGIKGSQTGTTLREMLVRAAAPHRLTNKTMPMLFPGRRLGKGEVATIFTELGIKTTDAHHNLLPLAEIFAQMKTKTAHMGNADQAKMFNAAFGVQGITGAQILTMSKGFGEANTAIAKSAGNLKRVYGIMVGEGLIAAWDKLRASVEVLATKIFDKLTPAVEGLLRGLGAAIPALTAVASWLYKSKVVLGAIGFVGATMVLNALVTAINTKMIPALIRTAVSAWRSVAAFFGYIGSMIRATIAASGFAIANAAVIGTVALLAVGLVLMWAAFNSGNPVVMKINRALADATNGFWGLGQLIAKDPILSKLFGVTASGSDSMWKHGKPGSTQYTAWMKTQHFGNAGAHPPLTQHITVNGAGHDVGRRVGNAAHAGVANAYAARSRNPR